MKVAFVYAEKKFDETFLRKKLYEALGLGLIPKKIFLAYTSQYRRAAQIIRHELKKHGKEVTGFSQVLGCSSIDSRHRFVLLLADGSFHAKQLAARNNVEILIFPALKRITRREAEAMKRREVAKFTKFLSMPHIGILVSTKAGQNNFSMALELRSILKQRFPEKKIFVFLGDNINVAELENFKDVFWINTACSGVAYENKNIINAEILEEFLKK